MRLATTITLLSASLIAALTASARTWSDKEQRTMEAELVRVDGEEAIFQKPSGMHYRFPIANLSEADKEYISKHQQGEAAGTAATQQTLQAETNLTKWLEKRLVVRADKRVKRARESALPQAEYIAFYYSASWCPPCRKFTPKLVEFYNEHRKTNPNFEIIFVSSDSNESAQEGYMIEDQMPWPAVDFDDAKDDTARQFAGNGIPCLVLVNREGEVLADSYVNGKYLGPTRVMNKLGELLNK